jgi:hypothetical protein
MPWVPVGHLLSQLAILEQLEQAICVESTQGLWALPCQAAPGRSTYVPKLPTPDRSKDLLDVFPA